MDFEHWLLTLSITSLQNSRNATAAVIIVTNCSAFLLIGSHSHYCSTIERFDYLLMGVKANGACIVWSLPK